MPEYISREATKKAIEDFCLDQTMSKYLTKNDCETARNAIARVQNVIDNIPAIDIAPVVHGRWIDNGRGGYAHAYFCGNCGWIDGYPFEDRYKYCPNCGAKMDESEDEQCRE